MILRPCLHCAHKEGCPIKADILARSRSAGLHLGSASFRCAERWKGFEPGVVARVTLYEWEPNGPESAKRVAQPPILGTICGHVRGSDGELIIWLDEVSSRGKTRIRLNPDYPGLELTHATRALCEECGRPHGAKLIDPREWHCDTCGTPYEKFSDV